ncbi:AAA family ATPase [Luteolibacter pohnpeiensis]|uniref:AAA family ATPase n=1 Tax=Luteolibacter pohnpeiensis TaxID=454153 RepID=A0A934S6T2_9BACT|nr:AAA family ATPase [Luteolibacter pohnpeiensis]MBK1884140.1 AAA family ATPase [Luteolibacter pohnpeiensis]
MTADQLLNHPTVQTLIAIQNELALKDIPFGNHLRFDMHGKNWGKILKKTYTGNFSNALAVLSAALDQYQNPGTGEVDNGCVVLDQVRQALDAVDIARASEDEHRLVVISGVRGSGKSKTLSLIHAKHKGHMVNAMPSWAGGYLNFLNRFAEGIGLEASRSAGEAEKVIISHLSIGSGVICIDEFNHFSAAAINFLKSVMNQTRWVIVTATVPHHLSRMASDRSTAQESVQFLRRAVAIIHIPTVSARAVELLQRAFYPDLIVASHSAAIAQSANRFHRLDSACQILADAENAEDIPAAIARHERSAKTNLKHGEQ